MQTVSFLVCDSTASAALASAGMAELDDSVGAVERHDVQWQCYHQTCNVELTAALTLR